MFVTLPCKTLFMSIEEPLSFIDFLPYPEEISFHLSFNKIASTFLSSGDRSGLIWMFCGRDWQLESMLQIHVHAIELRVTSISLGRCLSLSHFPILWQSLILCGPPTLSASKVDTLSKSLFRHWGRERPCCCSATPNRMTLSRQLSAVEIDWVGCEGVDSKGWGWTVRELERIAGVSLSVVTWPLLPEMESFRFEISDLRRINDLLQLEEGFAFPL